jgi:hypothetical protein
MLDLEIGRRIAAAAVTPDEMRALGDYPLAGRTADWLATASTCSCW